MKSVIKSAVISSIVLGSIFIGQIAIARISNPGGSGGAQTPWTSTIDAAEYGLSNVTDIELDVDTGAHYLKAPTFNIVGVNVSGEAVFGNAEEIKIPSGVNPIINIGGGSLLIDTATGYIGGSVGTTTFSGAMIVPAVDNGCTSLEAGAIMFDGTNFQGCNGTAWKQLDNI